MTQNADQQSSSFSPSLDSVVYFSTYIVQIKGKAITPLLCGREKAGSDLFTPIYGTFSKEGFFQKPDLHPFKQKKEKKL